MNSSPYFTILLKILFLHKFVKGHISDRLEIVETTDNYHIEELNPLRERKKLLVLDVDSTLFDSNVINENWKIKCSKFMRPDLHEFLTEAYKNYDIVIWSATDKKYIAVKMKCLGVTDNPDYKIAFYLDILAMQKVSVSSEESSTERIEFRVKPLAVIWKTYRQFSAKNTIMIDDVKKNFLMNPQSGLWIRPYVYANKNKDRELLKLIDYLKLIADVDDFEILNHNKWKKYIAKHCKYCTLEKKFI